MASDTAEAKPPRMGIPVIVYMVTLLGALYVWHAFRPNGLFLAVTVAAPAAALIWLAQRAITRRRVSDCRSVATRSYLRRFLPLMIAYVLLLFGAVWLNKATEPSGFLAFILAVLPALPLVGVIWAIGRLLVEEKDEYLRSLHVRQFLVATGFMLVIACVWGFLETFGQVPHVPMYWAFIIWCVGLGVGTTVNELRS
jgi:hypothetical protein